MKYHNKILPKPAKKKIPLFMKWGFVCVAIFVGLGWLYYFFEYNDLVNQPYYPSSLSLYIHKTLAWISACLVGFITITVFLLASYEWIMHYRHQKFIQYSLGTFLFISGMCLSLFFGSMAKTMVYTSLNAMSSQVALQLGENTSKQIFITERHIVNPHFQQEIQVKRGRVMTHIIDPVSYKLNIQLTFDNKTHHLDPYCYSGSVDEPQLNESSFQVLGQQSFLGFRCTTGCELYRYFSAGNHTNLTSSNFSTCRKIYTQQPSLR